MLELLFFCSEILFLCQLVQFYSPLSLLQDKCTWYLLRSLIHLEVSFVHDGMYGSICILLHSDIQFHQHHLLKKLFFPVCISYFFIKRLFTGVRIYVWIFNLIPFISVCFYVTNTYFLLLHLCGKTWYWKW